MAILRNYKASFLETEINKLCVQRIQITEVTAIEINTSAALLQFDPCLQDKTAHPQRQPSFLIYRCPASDVLPTHLSTRKFIKAVNCNHQPLARKKQTKKPQTLILV